MVCGALVAAGSHVPRDGRLLYQGSWACLISVVLGDDNFECKVYALEKVLKMKKDATTHVVFLDEAMKVS